MYSETKFSGYATVDEFTTLHAKGKFRPLALEEIDEKAKNTTQKPKRLDEKVGNVLQITFFIVVMHVSDLIAFSVCTH